MTAARVELTSAARRCWATRGALRFCEQAWDHARRASATSDSVRLAYAEDLRFGVLPALHRALRVHAPRLRVQALRVDPLHVGAEVARGLATPGSRAKARPSRPSGPSPSSASASSPSPIPGTRSPAAGASTPRSSATPRSPSPTGPTPGR